MVVYFESGDNHVSHGQGFSAVYHTMNATSGKNLLIYCLPILSEHFTVEENCTECAFCHGILIVCYKETNQSGYLCSHIYTEIDV